MPAPKKADRNPKLDANLQAQKKRYDAHAFECQKAKLVVGLVNGKRRPTARTIEKYGLQEWIDEKGELVVPQAYRPKPKIVVVQPPQQDITVKGVQRVVETVDPTLKSGPVSTKQVKDYFRSEQYQLDREGRGESRVKTFAQTASGANVLIKIGLVKDEAQDIMPVIRDTERVIKAVREREGTNEKQQTRDFHWLNTMCTQCPMIEEQLPANFSYETYGKLLAQGNAKLKGESYDKLTEKSVYRWPDIVKGVEETFGKDSEEHLYMRVFEEVPIRTELANIKVVVVKGKGKEALPDNTTNFLLIDGKSMVLHLNRYKTDRIYGAKQYTFSPALVKLVAKSLTLHPRTKLFDMDVGINEWLRTIFTHAGYKHFPYGPGQTNGDREHIVSGLRHTLASYFNDPKFNKDGKYPKERKLAELMGHDVSQALQTYRNRSFYSKKQAKAHQKM